MNIFRLKTGEYRFVGSPLQCDPSSILYIDPTTWCIHGKYRKIRGGIETLSRLIAVIPSIKPFTLAWIGDLHAEKSPENRLYSIASTMKIINPTFSLLLGDLINGSGEYRGSDMDDSWFENVWNIFKEVPNMLWVKGNHDIDPRHYEFYDWFERLWSINIGDYKFIAFDTYNEDHIISETSHTFISTSDTLWLRRKLHEDDRVKIVFSHHLFTQWRIFAYLALKYAVNLRYVFSAHDHRVYRENIDNVEMLVNGSGSSEVKEHLVSLTSFFKNGDLSTVTVKDIKVEKSNEEYFIIADLRELSGNPIALIRLIIEIDNNILNIYVKIGREGKAKICLSGKYIEASTDIYVVGKNIGVINGELYDEWRCPYDHTWRSYYLKKGGRGKIEIV